MSANEPTPSDYEDMLANYFKNQGQSYPYSSDEERARQQAAIDHAKATADQKGLSPQDILKFANDTGVELTEEETEKILRGESID